MAATLITHAAQDQRDPARGLAFPAAGAHGADRDHRLGGFDLGSFRPDQAEIRPGRQHHRGFVHDVFVGDIAVSKDHLFDLLFLDQVNQLAFGMDGDAGGVQGACQCGRIGAAFDSGIWVAVKATTS